VVNNFLTLGIKPKANERIIKPTERFTRSKFLIDNTIQKKAPTH
jgi:hypothetical protein